MSDVFGRGLPWTVAIQYFLILTEAIGDIPLLKQQLGMKVAAGPRP